MANKALFVQPLVISTIIVNSFPYKKLNGIRITLFFVFSKIFLYTHFLFVPLFFAFQ